MASRAGRDRWIVALLLALVAANLLGLAAFVGISLNSATAQARVEAQVEAMRDRLEEIEARLMLNETWVRTHHHPTPVEQPVESEEE